MKLIDIFFEWAKVLGKLDFGGFMSDTIENLQPNLELDAAALAKLAELEELRKKKALEEAARLKAEEEAQDESEEGHNEEEHHCFSDEHCQPPAGFEVFEGREHAQELTLPLTAEGAN